MMEAANNQKRPKDAQDGASANATSPYASGGGGVTFERKVAVSYLAHLLVGDGAAELGDERRVVGIAFQQAPDHPVDDLLITAARAYEREPSLILAMGVRRAPNLVNSDESTQKLIRDFVRGVLNSPVTGPEHRFALVVAGPQEQARQLATLADLAAAQINAPTFLRPVRTPGKFATDVRGRLDQVEALVRRAITDVEKNDPDITLVQQRTWELLSRLTVLMPRLESPDDTDWAIVVNSLIPIARGGDLTGASRLRDRLVALANEYPQRAATVDLTVLRRGVHTALDWSVRRNEHGWQALGHLNDRALSSIHDHIIASDGARRLHLDRGDIATRVIESATTAKAVVVYGESGTGKSALVLGAGPHPDATHVVRINLRHLPRTTLEFESLLGCSLRILDFIDLASWDQIEGHTVDSQTGDLELYWHDFRALDAEDARSELDATFFPASLYGLLIRVQEIRIVRGQAAAAFLLSGHALDHSEIKERLATGSDEHKAIRDRFFSSRFLRRCGDQVHVFDVLASPLYTAAILPKGQGIPTSASRALLFDANLQRVRIKPATCGQRSPVDQGR